MLNLLNAIRVNDALFWLLVILGIFLIAEIAIFAFLALYKRRQEEKPRRIVGLTLDTQVVQREFKVCEKFDPSGLIITAHYSDEPYEETLQEYTVVTPELIKKLAREGKTPEDLLGCRIYAPDLSVEGKPTVTVSFMDQTAAYAITVVDAVETAPEPSVQPAPAVKTINYVVTVVAPEELKELQAALYNGDTRIGEAVNVESGAAVLTAEEGEYEVRICGVPEGYAVSEATVSRARHICTVTITGTAQEEELAVAEDTAVAAVEQPASPVVIVEESFASVLRYDRSFTARLIQANDEIKEWYTELKNELLSYKKVHDRMSWKRESYNLGRSSFAKLAFRGETLCLYLSLNPESLADSKYKVESVADNTSYADTPCLYRIKNGKRAKYAKELIAVAAEQLEAPRVEREAQDYYLPYEGILELINKGLVKRNVKNKQDEIFFEKKKQETNN